MFMECPKLVVKCGIILDMRNVPFLSAFLLVFPLVTLAQGDSSSAQASFQTLIPTFVNFLFSAILPFLLGIAFLIFVWNVIRYFVLGSGSEDSREKARYLALYSIAGFIIIIIFLGVVRLLDDSLKFSSVKNVGSDYAGVDTTIETNTNALDTTSPGAPNAEGNVSCSSRTTSGAITTIITSLEECASIQSSQPIDLESTSGNSQNSASSPSGTNYSGAGSSYGSYWTRSYPYYNNNINNDYNRAPKRPEINGDDNGSTFGAVNQDLTFELYTYDPDGDDIKYQIAWSDYPEDTSNSNSNVLINYPTESRRIDSGTPITVTRYWSSPGTYSFQVRAVDTDEYHSKWATHTVTISGTGSVQYFDPSTGNEIDGSGPAMSGGGPTEVEL